MCGGWWPASPVAARVGWHALRHEGRGPWAGAANFALEDLVPASHAHPAGLGVPPDPLSQTTLRAIKTGLKTTTAGVRFFAVTNDALRVYTAVQDDMHTGQCRNIAGAVGGVAGGWSGAAGGAWAGGQGGFYLGLLAGPQGAAVGAGAGAILGGIGGSFGGDIAGASIGTAIHDSIAHPPSLQLQSTDPAMDAGVYVDWNTAQQWNIFGR